MTTDSVEALLRLGRWETLLHIFTPNAEAQTQWLRQAFPGFVFGLVNHASITQHLIISGPNLPGESSHLSQYAENRGDAWTRFQRAWQAAYKQFCHARLAFPQHAQSSARRFTFAWPELAFAPVSVVEQERPEQFFCLVLEDQQDVDIAIMLYSLFLATWWHIVNGGLCLHSSAVARGRRGFLFLGQSRAGKSTVARLSIEAGYQVLGDDLNFVIRKDDNNYALSAGPSVQPLPGGYADICSPLDAILSLVKDTREYLVPLSPRQVSLALFDSLMQAPPGYKLPRALIGCAFRTICGIARCVPGYEMHFRQSPDFWNVIDERFPG